MKRFFALMAMAAMLSTNVAYADEPPKNDVVTQENKGDESTPENDEAKPEVEIDINKKGSITVSFEKAKEGLKVTAYKVADVVDGEYVVGEAYKETEVDLNDLKDANSSLEAIKKLEKVAKDGVEEKTNKEGKAFFKELEVGVYLIKTEDNPEYDIVQSSLVSIPTFDETSKDMSYNIEITAKTQERPAKNVTPQTGVSKNIYIFAGIALVAAISGAVIGTKKKK